MRLRAKGVRETGQRAEQSWYRYERKELVRGVRKAGLRSGLWVTIAPDQPDLRQSRDARRTSDQMRLRRAIFYHDRLPELLVLWPPEVRNLGSVVCPADIDGLHVCDHFRPPYACADDSRGWNRWVSPRQQSHSGTRPSNCLDVRASRRLTGSPGERQKVAKIWCGDTDQQGISADREPRQ